MTMGLCKIECERSLPFCIEPTAIESIHIEQTRMANDATAVVGLVLIRMRSGREFVCLKKTIDSAHELRDRLHRLSSDPKAEAPSRAPPILRAMHDARLSPP